MEVVRKRNLEVLFCYEPYDELVLMNLNQFDKKNLKSIENEAFEDKADDGKIEETGASFGHVRIVLLKYLQYKVSLFSQCLSL